MYRSCNTVSKRHQEDQKTKFQKEQLGLSREQRLQYSCLENPMDGGAWKAAVHGVTKSRTRLNDFTFTFLFPELGTTALNCSISKESFHFFSSLRVAAAAAAKSLQSCPTLCSPRDGSPPGSPVPGILQARTLEWVAISFSNA